MELREDSVSGDDMQVVDVNPNDCRCALGVPGEDSDRGEDTSGGDMELCGDSGSGDDMKAIDVTPNDISRILLSQEVSGVRCK